MYITSTLANLFDDYNSLSDWSLALRRENVEGERIAPRQSHYLTKHLANRT